MMRLSELISSMICIFHYVDKILVRKKKKKNLHRNKEASKIRVTAHEQNDSSNLLGYRAASPMQEAEEGAKPSTPIWVGQASMTPFGRIPKCQSYDIWLGE